jgi:threonine dehydrogenase-like Zn-dependent dehydrogenase
MKAVCWFGKDEMRVQNVPDPHIINPRDVIVRITRTAICGSDLHLYGGYIPTMKQGDIVGHEFMGEIVEVGSEVKKFTVGDRVVVPFTICCGQCWHCKQGLWSLCENTNPNAWIAEGVFGYTCAGLFGYSHMTGGYAGGQAQFARVPFADVGCLKIESDLPDDKVLFLSDIFPTGYQAAEQCNIHPGDSIAVWGCGPVGQFAIRSAWLLGAARVIAIDRVPERLVLARRGNAETIDLNDVDDVIEELKHLTGGRGPDACIDAVGMEADGHDFLAMVDKAKFRMGMQTGRPTALRECIQAVRSGGKVSIPGVYGGFVDAIPMGAVMNKGLTLVSGQTHMIKYMQPLLERIQRNEIDPSEIITHSVPLDRAPEMYKIFRNKEDHCIKVVMDPWAEQRAA